MSGSSLPQNNSSSHPSIVASGHPPFFGSPQDLAKYTAATGGGFTARMQTQPTAIVPPPTFFTQPSLPAQPTLTTKPNFPAQTSEPPAKQIPKPMSAFAASAYESAGISGGIPPTIVSSKDYVPKLLSPLEPQPVDLKTFKGLKFVMLDSLQIEMRDIYDKISGTFQWEMCESQGDHCVEYIENECKNKRTFLVSTGSLGKETVPKIHSFPQLYAIYIFCGDVNYHATWTTNFPKIRCVCNDDDAQLVPQLAVDVAQAKIDWGNALLEAGKKDDAKQKFEHALNNLTQYAKNPEQSMVTTVKNLLEQCK